MLRKFLVQKKEIWGKTSEKSVIASIKTEIKFLRM